MPSLSGGHADEIQILMGESDVAFVDYVKRAHFERTALDHVQRDLACLLTKRGDFVARASLMTVLAQTEHLRRGYGIINWPSGTCDCRDQPITQFRGRCTGCGALLYADMLVPRRDVEDPRPYGVQLVAHKVAYFRSVGRDAEAERVKHAGEFCSGCPDA